MMDGTRAVAPAWPAAVALVVVALSLAVTSFVDWRDERAARERSGLVLSPADRVDVDRALGEAGR